MQVAVLGELANSIFSGPVTSIFNAMRLDENSFTCECEKEDKKVFKFRTFMGRFQMTSWQ